MNRATWLQDRRMQKFRDVLSRWEAGEQELCRNLGDENRLKAAY
jgi:hypothetical protein